MENKQTLLRKFDVIEQAIQDALDKIGVGCTVSEIIDHIKIAQTRARELRMDVLFFAEEDQTQE